MAADIPLNSGCLKSVEIKHEEGKATQDAQSRVATKRALLYAETAQMQDHICAGRSTMLSPPPSVAVCSGNVLTSQRVVDVVLKTLRACAASYGCMNNTTFGNDTFGYYETICGGSGAGPTWNGSDAVQVRVSTHYC